MKFSDFHGIDWDDEDDEDGNLAHCLRADRLGPNPERVVAEVIAEEPVQVKFKVHTADLSVVGPDHSRNQLWVVLFAVSDKRGDWLRPVTGWRAEIAERAAWEQQRGKLTP